LEFGQILKSFAPEERAKLVLGLIEDLAARLAEAFARAVHVERQHRHRGAVGIGLASLAVLGRSLQRRRDLFRISFQFAGEFGADGPGK
jgi:hypothetical protein